VDEVTEVAWFLMGILVGYLVRVTARRRRARRPG
jgi:hypothetical protein